MATVLIILIFAIGYLAIAMEHVTKVNKAAPALITGVLCWTIYLFHSGDSDAAVESLLHHLGEISSILFFLLGAMTIVELIDAHDGFDIITERIITRSKKKLLYIISFLSFFLSALLDNLTTSIVMVSLCAKLLQQKEDRLWFASMIIIAANAGGAWSPLGDVTTTMLWIGGQITALNIIKTLIIPSIAVCLVPTLIIGYRFKKQQTAQALVTTTTVRERKNGRIVLIAGVGSLLFVPFFKTVTHLPPFMGMMLMVGFMWIVTTLIHKKKKDDYDLAKALEKIDSPSILFFLGILLAVSALQSFGLLGSLATFLTDSLQNDYLIGSALGVLSAIVDNVPLVAASQGMYDLSVYPPDHTFWEFLALTTGTGGSAIIIGSAAGVAVMGIEHIKFGWYLKHICWIALVGFVAGIAVFLAQQYLVS